MDPRPAPGAAQALALPDPATSLVRSRSFVELRSAARRVIREHENDRETRDGLDCAWQGGGARWCCSGGLDSATCPRSRPRTVEARLSVDYASVTVASSRPPAASPALSARRNTGPCGSTSPRSAGQP
jgi:hypothetical protein